MFAEGCVSNREKKTEVVMGVLFVADEGLAGFWFCPLSDV